MRREGADSAAEPAVYPAVAATAAVAAEAAHPSEQLAAARHTAVRAAAVDPGGACAAGERDGAVSPVRLPRVLADNPRASRRPSTTTTRRGFTMSTISTPELTDVEMKRAVAEFDGFAASGLSTVGAALLGYLGAGMRIALSDNPHDVNIRACAALYEVWQARMAAVASAALTPDAGYERTTAVAEAKPDTYGEALTGRSEDQPATDVEHPADCTTCGEDES